MGRGRQDLFNRTRSVFYTEAKSPALHGVHLTCTARRVVSNRASHANPIMEKGLRFYAGGDWSGKPESIDDTFTFCVVALSDPEAWNMACAELRASPSFGMARDQEFHGHQMKPERIFRFLSAGHGLGMRVGALLIDKGATHQAKAELNHANVALALLRRFLPTCALQTFWYDEDIKGKKAEQEFETQVRRCNRLIYPSTQLKARSRNSRTSSLVQLADVAAYALSRQARKPLKHAALEQFLKDVRSDERNLIIGPAPWGEW